LTDCGGNETKLVQTITVEDTTPPTGTAPANIAGLQCKAEIPVANVLDVTTEADNCSGDVTVTVADTNNETSGCKGSPYIVTRTYTLTDCGGNETKLVQTITVEDTTPPTGTAPANIAGLQCKAEIPVANILDVIDETDNCSGDVTVTVVDTNNEASGCKGSPYIVTRTYTLTDCGGNTTPLVQTITVEDTTPPTGTAPANIAGLQCKDEIPVANILDVTTEADNCSGDVTVTVADTNNEASGCKGTPYIVTRTYTLTDCGGNETKLVQTITVEDTTPPTGTAPANIAGLQCKAEIPVANILDVTTEADNCSGDVTVTVADTNNEASGCKGTPYIVTRTYTLTDCGGNETKLVQTITVEDTTAPTGTAPANIIGLQCKAEIPVANILNITTEADNCSGDVTVTVADTNNDASGCKGSPYIVTRTYTLTDCGGNETKLVQTITVEDTTGPTTITAYSATVDVSCDAIPDKPALIFVDNCSIATEKEYTQEKINVVADSYSLVRTWIATDNCGNESIFKQIINVAVTNSQVTIPSTACNNGEVTTVNLSSLLPVGTPTTGTWAAVNNAAVLQGDVLTVFGLPVTTPENPPYVFEYKITDADCPRTIRINMTIDDSCESIVLPCGVVLVHNAFSPNGDGINENFIIDNIDDINCYPTNTVEIYNRWGILVFDTTGYNNTSRVFNGISQGRSTISQSSGLPSGVYFYILNYTSIDGNGNIQTNKKDGYLYLTK
jgi:gliding motility-associated-like protein